MKSNRKLLVISYYYAPKRDIASIRWSKLTKYITARGWDVDVITTSSVEKSGIPKIGYDLTNSSIFSIGWLSPACKLSTSMVWNCAICEPMNGMVSTAKSASTPHISIVVIMAETQRGIWKRPK